MSMSWNVNWPMVIAAILFLEGHLKESRWRKTNHISTGCVGFPFKIQGETLWKQNVGTIQNLYRQSTRLKSWEAKNSKLGNSLVAFFGLKHVNKWEYWDGIFFSKHDPQKFVWNIKTPDSKQFCSFWKRAPRTNKWNSSRPETCLLKRQQLLPSRCYMRELIEKCCPQEFGLYMISANIAKVTKDG